MDSLLVILIVAVVVILLFALIVWIGVSYAIENDITPLGWDGWKKRQGCEEWKG